MRTILCFCLAVVWLPVTAHCQLETLPGLELLRCASEAHDAPARGGCNDYGCCEVERSVYKTNQQRVALRSADLPPVFILSLTVLLQNLPARQIQAIGNTPSPPFAECWQFVLRTASPPRAPSIAS